jgi:hypothetical protein
MKDFRRILKLDRYEYGILINALYAIRKKLIALERETDSVDDLLLRVIDTPTK